MKVNFTVTKDFEGLRIDLFLSNNLKEYSRSFIKKHLPDGEILVNQKKVKPHYLLKEGDIISGEIKNKKLKTIKAQNLPIEILFENDDFAIINKQNNLVVHPSEDGSNYEGTLVNALLCHFGMEKLSDIAGELKPGIVHRLDKDTSGLLIIAKNNKIHDYLKNLLKNRKIKKQYIAMAFGHLVPEKGKIDAPLKRGTRNRKKFTLAKDEEHGKNAITEYEVIGYFKADDINLTLLKINLITGRTHQIRVHLASIGHPVLGDNVYGNKKINKHFEIYGLKRQFLHASELKFKLPGNKIVDVKSKIPDDLHEVMKHLGIDLDFE